MEKIFEELGIEKALLLAKLERLKNFTKTKKFKDLPPFDQGLLLQQEEVMKKYADILGARVQSIEDTNILDPNLHTPGMDIIGHSGESDALEVKYRAMELINFIDKISVNPRRKALANTNIETGVMYAVKSLS